MAVPVLPRVYKRAKGIENEYNRKAIAEAVKKIDAEAAVKAGFQ